MYSEIGELYCDDEETGTRMIVQTRHASQSYPNIKIKSPDTDMLHCMSPDMVLIVP